MVTFFLNFVKIKSIVFLFFSPALSQTESLLLIRPFINQLTRSEIHTAMAGGFASVSGSILAAYISMGVKEAMHPRYIAIMLGQ